MPTSEELQQELLPLRDLVCQNWNHRAKRNRYLTKMIIKIQNSKKLFFKYKPDKINNKSIPITPLMQCYEEAQSAILEYCCKNICIYDPEYISETNKKNGTNRKATIITWLNFRLKCWFKNCHKKQNEAPLSLDVTVSGEEGGMTWKDKLAAPPENEYVGYCYELVQWIASDPIVIHKNREKKLSEINAKDNETKTEINAREFLLALFEGTQKSKSKKEFNHSEIGRRFNIKPQTVRTLYERTCRPLLEIEAKKRGFEI